MDDRIRLYYKGVVCDPNGDNKLYHYEQAGVGGLVVMSFSKPLQAGQQVGQQIEVTKTEKGVKGPYNFMWAEPMHPNRDEWWAKDAACRKIIQLRQSAAKKPEKIAKFERLLEEITWQMTRAQKQVFLMRYIMDIK